MKLPQSAAVKLSQATVKFKTDGFELRISDIRVGYKFYPLFMLLIFLRVYGTMNLRTILNISGMKMTTCVLLSVGVRFFATHKHVVLDAL